MTTLERLTILAIVLLNTLGLIAFVWGTIIHNWRSENWPPEFTPKEKGHVWPQNFLK